MKAPKSIRKRGETSKRVGIDGSEGTDDASKNTQMVPSSRSFSLGKLKGTQKSQGSDGQPEIKKRYCLTGADGVELFRIYLPDQFAESFAKECGEPAATVISLLRKCVDAGYQQIRDYTKRKFSEVEVKEGGQAAPRACLDALHGPCKWAYVHKIVFLAA